MIFPSTVTGIPCQVEVTHYTPPVPMYVYGPGMGDAEPPEPAEIFFRLLDRKGYPAPWLEKKLDDKELNKIYEEIDIMMSAEYYGY